MTGCGDFSLRSKRQKRAVAPSPFLLPRALFCRPEAQAEGSLGTGVPRDDIPKPCLGRTSRDAVPNDTRDASLSHGRTKNGGSAGQSRGDFFEKPLFPLTIIRNLRIFKI